MSKTLKAKNWSARFACECGATYITTVGNVPAEVNKSASELVKKNVPLSVAIKIFRTQFKAMITEETED